MPEKQLSQMKLLNQKQPLMRKILLSTINEAIQQQPEGLKDIFMML